MPRYRKLLPLLTLMGALAVPAAASAASTITEYTAGLSEAPENIVTGSDGNLWFTQPGGSGSIGRLNPVTGAVAEFATPTVGSRPADIAAGPDGNLWFTEQGGGGAIGRITPAGLVTEFRFGLTGMNDPAGITAGPDGNLWFTEQGGWGRIGRITPSGDITEFPLVDFKSEPTDIVAGADGNLWFTERDDPGRIGRITPAGLVTEFSEGLTPDSGPTHIVAASNKKLYFTQTSAPGGIGRIKTDGKFEEYTGDLTSNSAPRGIAEGGDGALWFTEGTSPGRLGRLWPASGQLSGLPFNLPADATPAGVTRGPDGNVWFADDGPTARVSKVTVPPLADIGTPDALGAGKVSLNARVAPNSQPTTYRLEWGPTTEYGATTGDRDAGAVVGPIEVSSDVTLVPDAHYHVRVIAKNASGTAVSDDKSFYVTPDGEVVKEKPAIKPPPGTSTVVVSESPPVPGPQTGDAVGGLLDNGAPVLGENVGVRPLSGSVRVKVPGASRYVPLSAGARVPVGSLIDTRRGRVGLRSALGHGRSQSGAFWGAVFQVRQHRGGRGMTGLHLRGGSFGSCPTRGIRAGASALARETAGGRRRVVRRLWGQDRHGRFRTHGRDSVATVRGTRWVTTDRCDGTLTRVKSGKVLVRDLRRHRSVLLTAGRAYLARHSRR